MFNEVSVGYCWYTKGYPDCYIPGFEDPVHLLGENIPQSRTIEAGCIDVEDSNFGLAVTKAELLQQRVNFSNKFPTLKSAVILHGIITLKHITQVLDLVVKCPNHTKLIRV